MTDVFVAKKKKDVSSKGKSRWKKRVERDRKRHGMGPRYRTVAERLMKERRVGKFKAFNILPGRVRFETQEVREKVILLLRQHWMTQVGWVLTAFFLIFVPIGLIWVPTIDFMPGNFQFMAVVIWYLLVIAFVFEKLITWYFHVFIVTDERIIDVDFYHLLYKEVSDTKIDNIEDVTYRQGGVIKAMFNYGNVSIQTAAEQREFTIENVPLPNRVAKILNELRLEEEHEKVAGRVR